MGRRSALLTLVKFREARVELSRGGHGPARGELCRAPQVISGIRGPPFNQWKKYYQHLKRIDEVLKGGLRRHHIGVRGGHCWQCSTYTC